MQLSNRNVPVVPVARDLASRVTTSRMTARPPDDGRVGTRTAWGAMRNVVARGARCETAPNCVRVRSYPPPPPLRINALPKRLHNSPTRESPLVSVRRSTAQSQPHRPLLTPPATPALFYLGSQRRCACHRTTTLRQTPGRHGPDRCGEGLRWRRPIPALCH